MQNKNFLVILLFFIISSCSLNDINKRSFAELTSTAAGGYIGYELADGDLFSTTVGSTAGLILGKYIAQFISQDDYHYYKTEAIRILEMNSSNVTGYWKNPLSGYEGVIKIKGYYGDPECRLIEHIFLDKDTATNVYDTACRENSGQWAMVK